MVLALLRVLGTILVWPVMQRWLVILMAMVKLMLLLSGLAIFFRYFQQDRVFLMECWRIIQVPWSVTRTLGMQSMLMAMVG
ncbi:hypothetical protein YQ44_10625 [Janthinobacterium sp. 1_2014MBL_MicDiv]|nr:hypothetical protein YQ44_10625 [Janthinobacterium sp. 1_2014MBL_MicDiv]